MELTCSSWKTLYGHIFSDGWRLCTKHESLIPFLQYSIIPRWPPTGIPLQMPAGALRENAVRFVGGLGDHDMHRAGNGWNVGSMIKHQGVTLCEWFCNWNAALSFETGTRWEMYVLGNDDGKLITPEYTNNIPWQFVLRLSNFQGWKLSLCELIIKIWITMKTIRVGVTSPYAELKYGRTMAVHQPQFCCTTMSRVHELSMTFDRRENTDVSRSIVVTCSDKTRCKVAKGWSSR